MPSDSSLSESSESESTQSLSSDTSSSLSTGSSLSDNLSSSSSQTSFSSSSSSESTDSSGSPSSSSSSSSSWSSESSAWDVDPYYSILWRPEPEVRDYEFVAFVQTDFRHADAEVIRQIGPMKINFGGTYDRDQFEAEVVNVLDGYRNTKTFKTLAGALLWQSTMEQRIRHALWEMRVVFETQYPGELEERHRRI